MTTAEPTPPQTPSPGLHSLMHRLVTGLLVLAFLGYVLSTQRCEQRQPR